MESVGKRKREEGNKKEVDVQVLSQILPQAQETEVKKEVEMEMEEEKQRKEKKEKKEKKGKGGMDIERKMGKRSDKDREKEQETGKGRGDIMNSLEMDYLNRQKENELKLFENIKSDISVIISEQLKKRSKAEFEYTSIEKKFLYLRGISEEIEKTIKKENNKLIKEKELIKDYFEYTITNLDYIFIKYENIINDFSKSNNDMKVQIKNIKENELSAFESTYKEVKEKMELLKKMKENIIHIRNVIRQLEEEHTATENTLKMKNEEKEDVEKGYKELLQRNAEYMNEFEKIKEKCNLQMEEKKKTATGLNIFEEKIKEVTTTIQNLRTEKNKVTEELNDLITENEEILNKILSENNEFDNKCELLKSEIDTLENENAGLIKKKEKLNTYYDELEKQLKDCTQQCETKKEKDESITKVIKEQSKNLIEKKNILKEKENEYSDGVNQLESIKKENDELRKFCSEIEKQLEKTNEEIVNTKEQIEQQKEELINLEKIKKKNEKTKGEILNLIKKSEKILYEEKNSFFKISKYFNLISLSHEEYMHMKNESNEQEDLDTYTKNCDTLEEEFKQINGEVLFKKGTCKNIEKEIDIYKTNVEKFEAETDSINKEKKEIEEKLKSIEETRKKITKEMKEKKKNSEKEIEETEQMLNEKLQNLETKLTEEYRSKQIEHNNYLKQAEKEKLECDFNLFKTEILSNFKKIKEEKQKQLLQREQELKLYQQTYSKMKSS